MPCQCMVSCEIACILGVLCHAWDLLNIHAVHEVLLFSLAQGHLALSVMAAKQVDCSPLIPAGQAAGLAVEEQGRIAAIQQGIEGSWQGIQAGQVRRPEGPVWQVASGLQICRPRTRAIGQLSK